MPRTQGVALSLFWRPFVLLAAETVWMALFVLTVILLVK